MCVRKTFAPDLFCVLKLSDDDQKHVDRHGTDLMTASAVIVSAGCVHEVVHACTKRFISTHDMPW